MNERPVWGWVVFIGMVVIVAAYVFGSGGLSLKTVFGFLGWVIAGLGFFSFIGGEHKMGITALVVGIILANIF